MHESDEFLPDGVPPDLWRDLVRRVAGASPLAVLSGAGISAASGVPTFRGSGGLWKRFRAEELATPEAFARDPALVWEWYGWRRTKVHAAQPNAAHYALVDLAGHVDRLVIITQNVDGLHARSLEAHSHAHRVEIIELHGSLWTQRCTACHREHEDRSCGPAPGEIPHCRCGAIERPGVVWFGEVLFPSVVEAAQQAATSCDVMLVVGTSGLVQPAASLATLARSRGALVAEFNAERTVLSDCIDVSIVGPSEQTLPTLARAVAAGGARDE
jgi:NAD-dependent deacetylase